MTSPPTLRVARPTDDLQPLLTFYRDGLGLELLASFEDHQGFDGVILGRSEAPYHFEFTHHRGQRVGKAPTQDHLLVMYLPDRSEWKAAVARMNAAGFEAVPSYNPYWDLEGKTFEDPDGYRIVLQQAAWPSP